jgi:hypothetical protein
MKSTPSFATLLQRFFTERLMRQRSAGLHTISSYRDTFRSAVHCRAVAQGAGPHGIENVNAPFDLAFLDDLQNRRGITARSRKIRLA